MGKCDGRCTLLVICSLQLVSVLILLRIYVYFDIVNGSFRSSSGNKRLFIMRKLFISGAVVVG